MTCLLKSHVKTMFQFVKKEKKRQKEKVALLVHVTINILDTKKKNEEESIKSNKLDVY